MPHAVTILKKRSDFLRASRARKYVCAGFILQARNRRDQSTMIRAGFTCSKKVGNAVARNRAKRRLREVARLTLPAQASVGWDYVLIGRAGKTAELSFSDLMDQLAHALSAVHRDRT